MNILVPEIKSSDELQRNLCNYLIYLAEIFGCRGTRVKIENYVPKKDGYMDVVWISELGDVKLAIAVDGGLRKKSIKKLRATKAEYRLWIYYGNAKKLGSFLQANDPNGNIMLINLGNFRKRIRKASSLR